MRRFSILGPLVFVLVMCMLSIGITLQGCSSIGRVTDTIDRYEVVFKAAIQFGTITYLDKNPKSGPLILEITSAALESLSDPNQLVSVAGVESLIRPMIPWDEMPPEQVVLVDGLIIAIRLEVDRVIVRLGLTDEEDIKLLVIEVLTWIEDAALLVVPPG